MPRITFSANAAVYQGNPVDRQRVTDTTSLKQMHGYHSEDEISAVYIDQDLVQRLGVTGGRLRLTFDPESENLRISTTYGINEQPTPDQLDQLQSETETQWSDGIGGGVFSFLREEIPSSTIVMAILNEQPEFASELPPLTVDVYPDDDDRQTRIDWSETGGPDDFLLADLEEAVRIGNAVALAELGNRYLHGDLVEKNVAKGIELLIKSAKQLDEMGVVWLAQAYLDGDSVPADPARAESLLLKAIDAGSVLAKSFLAVAYLNGKSLPRQRPRAIKMLTEASEQGSPIAMAELGDCYEFGVGVSTDLPTALKWYEAALEQGFDAVEPAYHRVVGQMEDSGGLFNRIGNMFTSLLGKRADEIDVDEAVVLIQGDDPEMEAAVKHAQTNLNRFIEAVKNPKPGRTTSVKVRFEDGEDVEYMWLNELSYADGCFSGAINNDPVYVKNVKIGDTHEAHANEVNDWLIIDEDGGLEGGFTIELLQQRQGQQ